MSMDGLTEHRTSLPRHNASGVAWLREHAFAIEGQVRRTRTLAGLVHAYYYCIAISKYSAICLFKYLNQLLTVFSKQC